MRVVVMAVVAAFASIALASSSFASGGYTGGFRPPVKKPAKPSESQSPEKKKKKTGDAQTVRPAAIG